MTSTAVVLGIATLGTPEPAPDCDCATEAAGIAAISKGIMNFIGFSSGFNLELFLFYKSTHVLFKIKKFLLFSEALYEKFPRIHQGLLTPFRVRTNPGHHQHSRHAREQQPDLHLFLFSGLTGHEWQEPLTIGFQQGLDPFPHGYRFPREFRP